MLFNSFNFIVFFPIIFFLYYAIPARNSRIRNLYLLVVSYIVYLNWKPAYALILLGVTLITYSFAILIAKRKEHRNKFLITSGVLLSLLPLLIFKYYTFINTSITEGLSMIGLKFYMPGLNWAIPIGISFFSFQAVGYLWDVYYKRINVEKDILNYSLFLAFFPSIVSGPINKASLILPQLKQRRTYFDYTKGVEGLKFLLWGMFMKVVVADRAGLYVDVVYSNFSYYSYSSCFIASVIYSIQIYADFAGYSLMAIGTGKILGIELTENFRRPYFSYSVTDFWRRWHISLSTWLKDYIYIPLGGNRCNRHKNYWNIFITFLVSGIWHGANWTFVIWGIFHGVCQIIEKALHLQKLDVSASYKIRLIRIVLTFFIINLAWIFFRMDTISSAVSFINHILSFDPGISFTYPDSKLLFGIAILFFKDIKDEFFPSKIKLFNNNHTSVRWCSYLLIMILIMMNGVLESGQFIYAKF